MNHLAQKLSKTILFAALPLAILAGVFGLPRLASATAQADCTDIGSDGIADNIIVVAVVFMVVNLIIIPIQTIFKYVKLVMILAVQV